MNVILFMQCSINYSYGHECECVCLCARSSETDMMMKCFQSIPPKRSKQANSSRTCRIGYSLSISFTAALEAVALIHSSFALFLSLRGGMMHNKLNKQKLIFLMLKTFSSRARPRASFTNGWFFSYKLYGRLYVCTYVRMNWERKTLSV